VKILNIYEVSTRGENGSVFSETFKSSNPNPLQAFFEWLKSTQSNKPGKLISFKRDGEELAHKLIMMPF
jgi:hypothetical protein